MLRLLISGNKDSMLKIWCPPFVKLTGVSDDGFLEWIDMGFKAV